MSTASSDRTPTVDELPRLAPGESFRFACHPGVPCFNACCRALDLQLGPYDVLRLRRRLGLSSTELFERYVDAIEQPETGLPVARLRMTDEPGQPCPFVQESGCAVYEDRPAACRSYPLGRGCGVDRRGRPVQAWCLVVEPHCRGFAAGPSWTTDRWVADQGLTEYVAVDDRYATIAARAARRGRHFGPQQQVEIGLALYRLDRFGELLRDGELLARMGATGDERTAVCGDEVARLRFALRWLEARLGPDDSPEAPAEPGRLR